MGFLDERYGGRDDRYGRQGYRQDGHGQGRGRDGYGQQGQGGHGGEGRYGSSTSNGNGYPAGPRGQGPPTGPRGYQNGSTNGHTPHVPSPLAGSSNAPSSPKPSTPGDAALPTDTELDTIRARYLGKKIDNKKPRLRKQTDKRFIFDWKAEDDTSGDQLRIAGDNSGQGPVGTMFGGRAVGYDTDLARSKEGTPSEG